MSEANRGFGSAALMNYPPLGGYLVGAISLLTGDLISAFLLVLVVLTALSGAAFYSCARTYASSTVAALAAALYVVAPYRMIDLHPRFAFAEVLAFLWLPLVVKFLLDLRRRPTFATWARLVAAGAGLVVTHVLSALMILVVLAPVVLWIVLRERQWRQLAALAVAGVVTFTLAGFYLVPLLVERGLTYTEYLTDASWGDWRVNFLFATSTDSEAPTLPIQPLVEMSFWYSLAVFLVASGLSIRSQARDTWPLIAAGAMAILLQLSVSAAAWRLVPGMGLLQFPWRFQSVLVLLSCLLVAAAATRLRWDSGLLIGIAMAGALLFAVFLWRGITYDVTSAGLEKADISRLVFKEHMPRGVENWRRFERLPLDTARRVVTTPAVQVEVREWSSHRRRLRVEAGDSTQLALRTFYYPGWTAKVDGESVEIEVLPPLHAIGLQVTPGEYLLDVRFGPTPVQVLGSIMSVLTAGLLALAIRRG